MSKKDLFNFIEILRPGHWFKNLVVLFGAVGAIIYFGINLQIVMQIARISLAFLLACLVSSVNYAVNNICDEKNDSFHPIKKNRVLPNKKISKKLLVLAICLLLLCCLILAKIIYGNAVAIALFSLFVAGIFYNVKPLRFKDVPFLDVISESVNNPIRILIGWFAVSESLIFPPFAFLMLFWALGAVMMSAKRYAELKYFLDYNGKVSPHLYRNSYKVYSLQRIFLMVLFYLIATVVLFTFLSIKFRNGLLLSLPIILVYFIWFLMIMKEKNSPFRDPESIFAKKPLFSLAALMILLILMFSTILD